MLILNSHILQLSDALVLLGAHCMPVGVELNAMPAFPYSLTMPISGCELTRASVPKLFADSQSMSCRPCCQADCIAMLVNPDLYSEVFESIKSDLYESTTKKVCVIVSTSCVDSICAAKILHVSACCTASIQKRQTACSLSETEKAATAACSSVLVLLCFSSCDNSCKLITASSWISICADHP